MKYKKTGYIIISLLLAVAVLCGFFYTRELKTAQEEILEYTAVQDEYTTVIHDPTPAPDDETSLPETAGLPYTQVDFEALLLKNPDTVGWIAIPDSPLSYPVVQKDNAKYLNVSFDGKRSGAGTPFADKDNNMRELDANTILYAHNMGAGRQDMFGSLLSYKDETYYSAHRYIQFDTIYQPYGWWKVFAVIEHDIRSDDFEYLQLQFSDTDGFMDWITKAQGLSIYDSDMELTPNDHIITLSTCDRSRYGKSGRLLIMAVKMNENAQIHFEP